MDTPVQMFPDAGLSCRPVLLRHLAIGVGVLAALAAHPLAAPAHDSPEHTVEQLTSDLKRSGPTAELLCERATQYRELGKLVEAEADLTDALKLGAGHIGAANDLARVQWHRGFSTNALTTLDRALTRATSAEDRAPLLLTRAEFRASLGQIQAALTDCEQAFAGGAVPDLDWYLLRAQLQSRVGQSAAAAEGLKRGFEETGSGVLEAEWIEALIDAGQTRMALERIDGPLSESRWQSAWLLRRGRARLQLGDTTRARGDVHAALRELESRLESPRPDAGLLVDRGMAHALLGESDAARRDLAAARAAGAEPTFTWRLEARLAARP